MNELSIREKTHSLLHFIALAGTAAGLSFSKAVLSLSLVLGAANLILSGNYVRHFQNLRSSRPFLLIASLYFLHILALLWSEDLSYALNDLRIKLPMLILPVLIFAQPPGQHHLKVLLYLFLAGLLSTTLINYLAYNGVVGNVVYDDIRGLSLFGSHIRFGLLVALGALISLYFLVKSERFRALHLVLFLWFSYYTYFSQVISGNLALIIGIVAFIFYLLYNKNKKAGISFLIISTVLPLIILAYFASTPTKIVEVNADDLPKVTAQGNPYTHDFVEHRDTKGNLLYINLCDDELKREWAKVSEFDYDSLDQKQQPIRTTLIRYMTSKGLKKDAVGFKQMSLQDIQNVEKGIAETQDGQRGLIARFNGIKYQLQNNTNPNGHSLLQRIEHWKTGWAIVQANWLIGVGTGDVQAAFNTQYEKDKSLLYEHNRNRAHNQYLTMWISFGIFGLALFLYLLWRFCVQTIKNGQLLGLVFILIVCSSFLLEDTLETQIGVSFFAFFYSLFVLLEGETSPQA